jgi:hypothetical protein
LHPTVDCCTAAFCNSKYGDCNIHQPMRPTFLPILRCCAGAGLSALVLQPSPILSPFFPVALLLPFVIKRCSHRFTDCLIATDCSASCNVVVSAASILSICNVVSNVSADVCSVAGAHVFSVACAMLSQERCRRRRASPSTRSSSRGLMLLIGRSLSQTRIP